MEKIGEEFLADTPFGQIPILCVDGEEIPQSFAIARYLAKQFGEYLSFIRFFSFCR